VTRFARQARGPGGLTTSRPAPLCQSWLGSHRRQAGGGRSSCALVARVFRARATTIADTWCQSVATDNECRCRAFEPVLASAFTHAGPKSARALTAENNATFQESGSSSGPCSPRESVVSRRRFRPSRSSMLSWVFNLFRAFHFLALGRCLHRPSSHRLPEAPPPRRGAELLDPLRSLSRVPLRVSMSEETGRSLARPAGPLEVLDLVVQPGNSRGCSPWLIYLPWTTRCIAALWLVRFRTCGARACMVAHAHPCPLYRSLPG
jgi:hypothetical protein